ncbi:LysR family transcriptional regulator [Legionella sainthelensi]|uniref:LysR family transcriptional regulator n=1 Tax=Legionella sainthelensi TaxID=28087 RepID=A0A0W0YIW0_9GAMM|nr:LysR family transcriptional regulator [Legionella sainthelensi]KTD56905.1 LysR family transcriptional regulator [Legionella sainthelensi]VEH37156.1 LysR family transcriptional regulator [Legionella sainthelensi]
MDIVEIKSFLAVIEFRSFTLAAKRVHITQSAMSKRIQKMENELGVRLFIVEGSKITLTEAASHFVPYARQMLAAYNSAIKSFKDDAQMLQHHVVVGATVFVSHYILPSFLSYLKTIDSSLIIHIRTMAEHDIDDYLNKGTVDLVISPDRDLPSKIIATELWQEKYYYVANKSHELSQVNRVLSLADFVNHPAIFTQKSGVIRDKVESAFNDKQLNLNVGLEISTLDAIKSLVEFNLGWSVLPSKLISNQLKILDVDTKDIILNFNVFYLKKRMEERAITNFLHIFDKWQGQNLSDENKPLNE